jgi:YD repeat-containing protein
MTNEIKEYDNNGNMIHSRYSDGFEVWYDYDTNGNEIHSRDSRGYEVWREYDNNGKCIHYRDSTGREWRREYDNNGKLINTRNTSGATGHHHAAAEEKVRGELQSVVDANASAALRMCRERDEAKSRAERAEAERDAMDKQVGELIKRVDEARSLYLAEKSKNADAKRKGAYEALTKFEERVFWYPGCLATLGNIRAFRDSLYAPTPARSVTLKRVWSREVNFANSREVVITWDAQRSNYVKDGRAYETLVRLMESLEQTAMTPLSPTEYTALCALAEGK